MKVNEEYSLAQILQEGFVERQVKDIDAKVFLNGTKVYFFEPLNKQNTFRLYSIINKRSFFL